MPQLIALHFSDRDMALRYDPAGLADLQPEEFVVARRDDGEDVGRVAAIEWLSEQQVRLRRTPAPQLLRRANEQERNEFQARRSVERKALSLCKSKSAELGLPMKISHARLNSAEGKIVFHFTSEQRVDFRQLVRELSAVLKTRVELWQIGVRDEAKMLDGLGICGLRTCCSQWLDDFHPINIRMAKQQDINLPPNKLSGQCGRLLCCLSYEVDQYKEMSKALLPKGSTVRVEGGEGVVIDRNILMQTYLVSLGPGRLVTAKAADISDVRVPAQMKEMARVVGRKAEEAGSDDGGVPDSDTPAGPSSRSTIQPRLAAKSSPGSTDAIPPSFPSKRRPQQHPPKPADAGADADAPEAAEAGAEGAHKKRRRRRRGRKGGQHPEGASAAEASFGAPSPTSEAGHDDDGGDEGAPDAAADSPEGAKGQGRSRRRRRGRRGHRGGGEGQGGGPAPAPAGE